MNTEHVIQPNQWISICIPEIYPTSCVSCPHSFFSKLWPSPKSWLTLWLLTWPGRLLWKGCAMFHFGMTLIEIVTTCIRALCLVTALVQPMSLMPVKWLVKVLHYDQKDLMSDCCGLWLCFDNVKCTFCLFSESCICRVLTTSEWNKANDCGLIEIWPYFYTSQSINQSIDDLAWI